VRVARLRVGEAAVEATIEESIARWDGGEAPLENVTLLAPCQPTKIVCVGQNYRAHAAELGNPVPVEPLLFFKPPSAIVSPGGEIEYPPWSELLHYEAELAVVIATRCRNARASDALGFVFGYTCFNDVTARDIQYRDNQWGRAKGFDGSACIGPWIETELDPSSLAVRSYVNGELRQDGATSDLVFPVPELIEFISGVMTLEPGDVIATGTPAGVGELAVGDTIEVDVENVGRLTNVVAPKPV